MIELKGRIAPVIHLRGKIGSGTGGGGALQAKTVTPSNVEQVITPDEEFYGLSSVTVKAVDTIPSAEGVLF